MRTHYQYHLKGLVKTILCFQTGLAIVVFMVFLITRAQLNFVANMELGYQIDNRLIVKDLPAQALFDQPQSALLSAIGELPGVVSVTATSINLTQQVRGELSFTWPNGEKIQGIAPSVVTHFNAVDALGLNLLAGRDFSEQQQSDWYQKSADGSEKITLIVTESMVRLAGYDSAQEVIGMTVTNSNEELTGKIIGVVSDVKIGSAKHKMTPLSFNLARNKLTTANIIINIAKTTAPTPLKNEVLRLLESRFSLLDIEVKSLKDDYAKHYKNEQQVITLSRYLFILSSALTIISLAVLVSQTIHVQQRTLAIKKVLGSSVAHLINELSFGYLKLVSISLIASMPLVYWLMNEWLNNFNDRISQPLWLYFLVAFAVVTITWLIIAMLAYKAAITRPSLILRDE
jgi:putative ABC transport system permease protein